MRSPPRSKQISNVGIQLQLQQLSSQTGQQQSDCWAMPLCSGRMEQVNGTAGVTAAPTDWPHSRKAGWKMG